MTAVLLAGTGEVGVRAARQLVDTPGLDRVLIASRDPARARDVAAAMGERAAVFDRDPVGATPLPDDVAAVAIASAGSEALRWARHAAGSGVPAALVVDGVGEAPGGPDAGDVVVVTGCGLGPGLTDVLARHAAAVFDTVHEVHVARVGASGRACVEAVRAARREVPGEWRDGAWRTDRGFGPELVWFPEPVGARECHLVREGLAALVTTVPSARHATARLGSAPALGRFRRGLGRDPVDQGWGAARVEVVGWRGDTADVVVYGVVDRVAVVSGVVLAVTAANLAGVLEAGVDRRPGVHPLGAVAEPVPFLTELAHRGVKAATFEGVVPH